MWYINFKEATNMLGAPPGVDPKNCGALPVMLIPGAEDNMGTCFVSFWKPTPEDIEKLKSGEFVRLIVRGTRHPPVMVDIAPAEEV